MSGRAKGLDWLIYSDVALVIGYRCIIEIHCKTFRSYRSSAFSLAKTNDGIGLMLFDKGKQAFS
jgi:hypothetical protein